MRKKKLLVTRETVRALASDELREVGGAGTYFGCVQRSLVSVIQSLSSQPLSRASAITFDVGCVPTNGCL